MPSLSARDYVQAKRSGRATAVRVQPTGTAVTDYQVSLGQRHSLREAGVIGLPSWSDRQTQSETWARVPRLSATCPRRIVAFDGGRGNIDKTMEFGDEFAGSALDVNRWGASTHTTVSGGALRLTVPQGGGFGLAITKGSFSAPYRAIARVKNTVASATYIRFGFGVHQSSGANYVGEAGCVGYRVNESDTGTHGANIQKYSGSWENLAQVAATINLGVYYRIVLSTLVTGTTIYFAIRPDGGGTPIVTGTTTDTYRTSGYLSLMAFATGVGGTTTEYDWIAITKYTANEPIAGTAQPTATNRALSRPMSHADLMRACCAA